MLGSVHLIDDAAPCFPEYWLGKTVEQVERQYLEETLRCVRCQDDFDVLGHLTYISKVKGHPAPRLLPLETYRDTVEEIMKVLIAKGKGIEVNTSGVDRCGDYLRGRSTCGSSRILAARSSPWVRMPMMPSGWASTPGKPAGW